MSNTTDRSDKRRHDLLALSLVGLVAAMVGLSFASVPLYRMFCQVTGYGGMPQRADEGADEVLDRTIPSASTPMSIAALPWTLRARAADHGREDRRDRARLLQGDQQRLERR